MRISDWSSDVCSSDLACRSCRPPPRERRAGRSLRRRYRRSVPNTGGGCSDARRRSPNSRARQARFPNRHLGAIGMKALIALDLDGTLADSKRTEEHTSDIQSLMRITYAVFYLKK